jgi:HK97 family phage prohead protease
MPDAQTPPKGFEREVGPGGLETRTVQAAAAPVETRAATDDDDGGPGLVGYGAVTEKPFRIEGYWDSWDEEVAAGAFEEAIADGADVRSMFNHDTNWLLGRTTSGSLRLEEDDTGLRYEVDINADDPNAMSVHARVERGDVDGSSIWFRVERQEWTYPTDKNGLEVPKRRILTISPLYETGPVVFPANAAAGVSSRSGDLIDAVLRSAGVTEDTERAGLAALLLADPGAAEAELRGLFARAPELRDAACAGACSCEGRGRDAIHGAGDAGGNAAGDTKHRTELERRNRTARGLAALSGLPLRSN